MPRAIIPLVTEREPLDRDPVHRDVPRDRAAERPARSDVTVDHPGDRTQDRTQDRPQDRTHDAPGTAHGQPGGTGTEPQVVVVKERSWGAKIVMVLLALALLVVAGLFAFLWLPTWWADQVSTVVDGRVSMGILVGVVCGLVFTAIPLALLRRTFGLHAGITSRVLALIAAAVVAAPNLTTVAIELGSTDNLRSARTALNNAPGFRTASLIGAVVGALLVLVGWSLMFGRRRRSRRIEELEAEVRERDERIQQHELEAKRAADPVHDRVDHDRVHHESPHRDDVVQRTGHEEPGGPERPREV